MFGGGLIIPEPSVFRLMYRDLAETIAKTKLSAIKYRMNMIEFIMIVY
jgi:hypothetical protein